MRLTLDLDYPSRLRLLMSYFNVRGMVNRVEVNPSAGGKGFHIVGYGMSLSLRETFPLRLMLGDDAGRVEFDRQTLEGELPKPTQVLWTKKGDREVEPMSEEDLLLSPFWSKMPARKG